MNPEEMDREIREKIDEIYELIENNVTANRIDVMSSLVDQVIAQKADTWEEAYGALAQVIAKYGSEASMEVGEIEEGRYSSFKPEMREESDDGEVDEA